jgi:hypothetical protein
MKKMLMLVFYAAAFAEPKFRQWTRLCIKWEGAIELVNRISHNVTDKFMVGRTYDKISLLRIIFLNFKQPETRINYEQTSSVLFRTDKNIVGLWKILEAMAKNNTGG